MSRPSGPYLRGRRIDPAAITGAEQVADLVDNAFLAYNSILPEGYMAEPRRGGCAPMRAHTLYEQIEHDQPGTPAHIRDRRRVGAIVRGPAPRSSTFAQTRGARQRLTSAAAKR